MASPTLLPDPEQVELVRLVPKRLVPSGACVTVVVRAHATSSRCPVCGASSARTHSRYVRILATYVGWQICPGLSSRCVSS